MASPVQTSRPTKRWLRRNGTSRVPYGKMAAPERDKPRSLRKDGFAGTGQAAFPTERWLCRNGTSRVPYEKMAAHGGLKTHKVRIDESSRCFQSRPTNDGFAGTGQAAFPTKGWLCRKGTSHVPYEKMAAHGGLKTHKVRIDESSRCFQYTASPVQTSRPTKRWLRRNGTSRVPYGKMAAPERGKPRSLRKDGFAGTGQATFPTVQSAGGRGRSIGRLVFGVHVIGVGVFCKTCRNEEQQKPRRGKFRRG